MPVDISGTLRQALSKLETEKARIERQIAGLRQALNAGGVSINSGSSRRVSATKRGRKRMSPAERKAASRRMKAYWKARRAKSETKASTKKR